MHFQLEHWHWWILTLVFVVSAAVLRGPIHLSLTAATMVAGLLAWFNPEMPARVQLLTFGLVVTAGIVIAQFIGTQGQDKNSAKNDPEFADRDSQDSDDMVGREFTLDSPIVGGVGSLCIDDKTWKLRGEDADAGVKIQIVAMDGIDRTLLQVRLVK